MSSNGLYIVLGYWHIPCNFCRQEVEMYMAASGASDLKFTGHKISAQRQKVCHANWAAINTSIMNNFQVEDFAQVYGMRLFGRTLAPDDRWSRILELHRQLFGPHDTMSVELLDVFSFSSAGVV